MFKKQRWLISRVLFIVLLVIGLKLLVHVLGWEFISLNPLFSGIVAGNVFLMGFLLSGVLADYKESERLSGELATSLETVFAEIRSILITNDLPSIRESLARTKNLTGTIRDWFYKKERTQTLMDQVNALGESFIPWEKHTQPAFVARLRQEISNLRRLITRVHTIRETSFVRSGYLIADATTVFLMIGLILSKIDPFYESMFYVSVITFLLVFLLLLIRDLDNPFGYYQGDSSEDVSLKPLEEMIFRLNNDSSAESNKV